MQSKAKYYFKISTSSGVPIYRQIIDQVKTLIAIGRLVRGEYLPSVRQVAKELEINPITVLKAYSQLEKENVLKSIRGRGMIVDQILSTKKDLVNREDNILLLLNEVVIKGKQLSLKPKRVIELLKSLWEEKNDE